MEGIKQEFTGNIDNEGVLRLKMVELRQLAKRHPNTQVIVTVEVLNGGDIQQMKAWYKNYVLPKVVTAWRNLGENYTVDQADFQLAKLTTVRKKTALDETWIIAFEDMDRAMWKRYLDEVTIICSIHLNCILT